MTVLGRVNVSTLNHYNIIKYDDDEFILWILCSMYRVMRVSWYIKIT